MSHSEGGESGGHSLSWGGGRERGEGGDAATEDCQSAGTEAISQSEMGGWSRSEGGRGEEGGHSLSEAAREERLDSERGGESWGGGSRSGEGHSVSEATREDRIEKALLRAPQDQELAMQMTREREREAGREGEREKGGGSARAPQEQELAMQTQRDREEREGGRKREREGGRDEGRVEGHVERDGVDTEVETEMEMEMERGAEALRLEAPERERENEREREREGERDVPERARARERESDVAALPPPQSVTSPPRISERDRLHLLYAEHFHNEFRSDVGVQGWAQRPRDVVIGVTDSGVGVGGGRGGGACQGAGNSAMGSWELGAKFVEELLQRVMDSTSFFGMTVCGFAIGLAWY